MNTSDEELLDEVDEVITPDIQINFCQPTKQQVGIVKESMR